nr:translation initiation factor IF-2-like [Peromyscus maniculatus bairdii]
MTPLSEGPEIQKCTEGFLKTPVSAQGPLQHPPGSAAPGLRVHWPAGIWGQPGISSPAASRWLSGSLYSSIDPSPDASACCTGARLRGGARSPAPPQPSGKQPPQPSSASVPGLCPAPGTVRPGPEAGRGPVRRPLSRGGEETQGDQEEEQERPSPAGGRDQPGRPTLAFRFTYAQGAAQRPGCAAPARGGAGAAAALHSAPGAASRAGGM